jgi:hypothetical protein
MAAIAAGKEGAERSKTARTLTDEEWARTVQQHRAFESTFVQQVWFITVCVVLID